MSNPVAICWICSIVGSELLDEGAEARDRCCNDRVRKLCLCPGDIFSLKDGRIGGQAGNIEGCEAETTLILLLLHSLVVFEQVRESEPA
jgi:hypothetical protein